MYFILSKLLIFLLSPLYWILALLIIALISKIPRNKKRFLLAAVIVCYVFSIPFFLKAFEKVWDIDSFPADTTKKYSCAIVLGGFSSGGNMPGGFFNSSADRFIQGVKLMETKQASHILISGGNGSLTPGQFREAAWVRIQLLQFNIPDSLILVESKSKNTIENAAFTKVLLEEKHLPPPYLLVTSAFHMRRSLMIFKKAGIDVVPYPCNFLGSGINFSLNSFLPEANTLFTWEYYTKEVVGYVVNYFK